MAEREGEELMGKLPYLQFYPSDWARDLEEHPLEIEGAWIRICCKLWWEENRGTSTKKLENWAKILRENPRKTLKIFEYLLNQKIGDGVIQNGSITITSRRMVYDEKIRKIRAEAGSKGGNPALVKRSEENGFCLTKKNKQNPTLSVSSSSSVSYTDKKTDTKASFGAFENVKLSIEEFEKLKEKFGEEGAKERIENLSSYVASKGKRYKSHYATILVWEKKNGNPSINRGRRNLFLEPLDPKKPNPGTLEVVGNGPPEIR